jgi:hypothetical protein
MTTATTNRPEILKEIFDALPNHPITDIAELNRALALADQLGNLLSPVSAVDTIPQMHAVSFRYVFLDEGDVYRGQQFCQENERAPSRQGLLKLWRTAAGRDVYSKRVDDNDEHVRTYEVAVALKSIDGREVQTIKQKEVDLRPGSPQVERMTDKQLAHNRQMIGTFAEGKAHNRAVRQAMNLKQKYTLQQLERPFIIPVLLPMLDTSDVQIRRLVAAHALGVVGELYGQRERQALPAAQPETVVVDRRSGEVVDGELLDDDDFEMPPEEPTHQGKPCTCPCGCTARVETAEALSACEKAIGTVRCKDCYPGKRFDFKRHADLALNLKIPSRPEMTVETLKKWRGAA